MKDKRRLPNVLLCTLVLLILILPFVSAITEYPNLGGISKTFDLTFNDSKQGDFTKALNPVTDVTITSVVLNNARFAPLISDLDNNGTNEIIIIEKGRIKIFSGSNLESLDLLTVGTAEFNTPYLFDVDGNGLIDIVLQEQGIRNVIFVEWNGTDLTSTSNLLTGSLNPDIGTVACGKIGECFYIGNTLQTPKSLFFQQFNKTNESTQTTIIGALSAFDMCVPRVPVLTVTDLENDGIKDYVTGFSRSGGGTDDSDLYVYKIDSDSGFTSTHIFQHPGGNVVGLGCNNKYSEAIPVEINGFSGEKEIIFGEMTDTNRYRMFYYDKDGNQIESYPFVTILGIPFNQEAEGLILSNPFTGNFFSDTGTDFCLTGYNSDSNDQINLLCASETGSSSFFKGSDKGNEWHYESPLPFNITTAGSSIDKIVSPLTHSINHAQSSEAGSAEKVDEILTPYGIFALDSFTLTRNTLSIVYGLATTESAIIASDVQNNGNQDLLFLTTNNLFYHDDNFVNSQGRIKSYTIDPCIDATIKINETLTISITVEDKELDLVSARAIAYATETNELDNGWSVNANSGTVFQFKYVLNETTTSSQLIINGRDVENADLIPYSLFFSFSVANNGVQSGDCISSAEIVFEEEEALSFSSIITEGTAKGTNTANNSIVNSLEAITQGTGIGIGIFWLIIIAVGIFSIFEIFVRKGLPLAGAGMGSIAWTMIMIIMGTFLGFISPIILIVMFIFGIFVVIMFARNMFTGGSGDSGMA